MVADNFFERWSHKNAEQNHQSSEVNAEARLSDTPIEVDLASNRPLPTQEDLDTLTHESDFSPFMAQGVDEGMKRAAMKKLFSDPHFNIMDGLDIYIDDYNKYEAMTPAILASLNHVKDLLDPLSRLEKSMSNLLETSQEISTSSGQATLADAQENILEEKISEPIKEKRRYAEETDPDASTLDAGQINKDPSGE